MPDALAEYLEYATDYTRRTADCLEAGGAIVDYISPVELTVEKGPALGDGAMAVLWQQCHENREPAPVRPTDRASREYVYSQSLEVVDCLRKLGYEPDDPPSLEAYLDGTGGSTGLGWTPYSGLDRLQPEKLTRARKVCEVWLVPTESDGG
jgi:hypothetical protein